MIPPKAVIFDCDGVIVDSEAPAFAMLAADFTAHGLPMTADEVGKRFIGGTVAGLWKQARQMGATLPESWVEDFYERLYALLAKGVPLVPGIEDVLDRLDEAGIAYAVGSNGSDRKMQITIGQYPSLMGRLRGRLFSGQTLGAPKPAPDVFLHAARALGMRPDQCAVVDDSPTGCRGGRNAGMRVFGFAAHSDGAELAAIGATVFHRMADLPALLGLNP
ncbi:MAG: HAD family hydrolase [Paracoccaceae bacterium]